MSAYNKFNDFAEQFAKGVHAFGTHTFKVMLSNELPVASDAVKADVTEIAAGNGYTAGGAATTLTVSETGGIATVNGTQVEFQAAGGVMADFRYFVVYNDTAAGKPLVCWFDRGSVVSLQDGDKITVRFSNLANGPLFDLQ